MAPDAGGSIPAEPERQPDAPVGDYPMHDPAVAGDEVEPKPNTTMENLLKCDGRRFRANIQRKECDGKIRVENGRVYMCQNVEDGTGRCKDKLGYMFAWYIGCGRKEDIEENGVTDFHLLPTTAAEIESYKDWQVGDKISRNGMMWKVIFRSGKLVVCEKENGRASTNYTCDELYDEGFRLVAEPEPEDDTVELTMDEIAKKVGVPVEKLRIKKQE